MKFISRSAASAVISLAFIAITLSGVPAAAAEQQTPAFRIVPIWFHVHTNLPGDDGGESPRSIADYLKPKGYQGVVLTPHGQTLTSPAFIAAADEQNKPDFIVARGREICTNVSDEGRVMCHMNTVGDMENPPELDLKYDAGQLPALVKELENENTVYIWNHPWSCRQWEGSAALFKGIEFFNDIGPGYISGESYNFEKSMYLGALKSGHKIFVVAGIDMHNLIQAALGEFTTYVFPDEFNRESLVAAIRNGGTIAAFNAKINFLNMRPSLTPRAVAGNEFEIKGAFELKTQNGPKPALVVYKDGVEYTPRVPARFVRTGAKNRKGFIPYELSFGGALAAGESACYVFEIPHYMFSSPYCLVAE
jgi:predicted metal-dependent phosphoesterase TrpH